MSNVFTLSQCQDWLQRFTSEVAANKEYLTDLDAQIGDADHGSNMARGTAAALEKITQENPADFAALGKSFGMTLVSTVGGASGPLFGTLFLRFGVTAGAVTELDAAGLLASLEAGFAGVVARGKAQAQDKTMVDVLEPALATLAAEIAAGKALAEALAACAETAQTSRDATAPLEAKKGRASYLGARSVGHIDPGAATSALLFATLAATVAA